MTIFRHYHEEIKSYLKTRKPTRLCFFATTFTIKNKKLNDNSLNWMQVLHTHDAQSAHNDKQKVNIWTNSSEKRVHYVP